MDPSRFDALTRILAGPASRRRTLGLAVAAALAPLTTAAQPAPASCRPNGRRCSLPAEAARHGHGKRQRTERGKRHLPSCAKCCSRFGAAGPDGKPRCACKPEGEACANPSQCCGGLCRNGTCTRCPGDLTACDGNCVDLQSDHDHCGACATPCADGQRCVGGTCVCDGTSCPRGCCDADAACQRGTSDQACGVGGADCQTCQTCTTCDGTTCVNATACCGDTAVCQSGTCTACAPPQVCHAAACCTPDCTGICGGASDGCGGTCTVGCETGFACRSQTCVACQANGSACAQNDDCCSDNCSNGFCCAAGRVGLANGSCALPCDLAQPNCADCGVETECGADISSGMGVCGHDGFSNGCISTATCRVGLFCQDGTFECRQLC